MRAGRLFSCVLAFLVTVPLGPARAAEPSASAARCSRPEVTRARRSAEKLYREGRYAEAVEALRRTKDACWSALDATDRGWLVSDLGLAALRAGQPELCRQVLDEAPAELDAHSRVAKAIAHNRGLCQAEPAEANLAVKVFSSGLLISSPSEIPEALTREWDYFVELRDGQLPGRREREIDQCTDTEGVTLGDLQSMPQIHRGPIQAQLLRCRAMKAVSRARPSRVSHVRNLFATKELGKLLPADVAPEFSFNAFEAGSPESAGLTWAELDGKARFKQDPDRKEVVRVEGDGVSGYLGLWALGDFNGDGFEDILLVRSMGPDGGSAFHKTTFLLTRTQPGGRLRILERME